MARPLKFSVSEKQRIVLSVLCGECSVAEAALGHQVPLKRRQQQIDRRASQRGRSPVSTPTPPSTSNRHNSPGRDHSPRERPPARCQARNCSTRSTLNSAADRPLASNHRLSRPTCRNSTTVVNGVQPRRCNSAEYASANGTNGPVINTLQTVLDRLAIVSSFSENKKNNDRQNHWRYADVYAAISPIRAASPPDIGITRSSAYS